VRCIVPALAATVALAALAAAPAGAVPVRVGQDGGTGTATTAGTDLPSGFTDGVPVGSDTPEADLEASGDASTTTTTEADPGTDRASTKEAAVRYFGDDPWKAINEAAQATTRCDELSPEGLVALTVAPVFKESSAATTAATAPSPMTLSRYDEWTGIRDDSNNRNANYGLYAFRDPTTQYLRAYWHPGIGIWQYDSAGVGAPFTAVERMDVRIVAGDVAKGMAARYCDPPANIVGHEAPFTDQERRDAAWWPWWAGSTTRNCAKCQVEFDGMTEGGRPYFKNIKLVAGISRTGGAEKRTCTLAGRTGTFECWYVNPSVGVIQGASAWATVSPDGNGDPTVQPAPLSRPFYVLKVDGYEERHWIRADTGYDIDITARRQLGKNARPRTSQEGSGLLWYATSALCDLTAHRGPCGTDAPPTTVPSILPAPEGMTAASISMDSPNARPVPLDADGDGRGDVFWYTPGASPDPLWLGQGGGRFSAQAKAATSTYDDVIPLDVDGDGRDDLLFNQQATGAAVLWRSTGGGAFTSIKLAPGAGHRPIVGDFDGDGRDEIIWYGPGGASDSRWDWHGSGFNAAPLRINGNYATIVGDFDGNGTDDIVFYAPGTAGDSMWLHKKAGGYATKALTINGTYFPFRGDFDGNGVDDIVWYAPGTTRDSIWFGGSGASFAPQAFTVNLSYTPIVADLGGDGRDDLLWYARGDIDDLWTRWGADRSRRSVDLALGGTNVPVVGAFSGGGGDGIVWYGPGSAVDVVWFR